LSDNPDYALVVKIDDLRLVYRAEVQARIRRSLNDERLIEAFLPALTGPVVSHRAR
jgi:hypothetical protein